MIYYLIIAAVIGTFLGFALGVISTKMAPPAGTMIINLNDPTKELFEIKFEQDLDYMLDSSYAIFKTVVIDKAPKK